MRKPGSEYLRGDVHPRFRPNEGKAARLRERRFEAGCGRWVRRKEGERLSERDWTSEEIAARNKAGAALLVKRHNSLRQEHGQTNNGRIQKCPAQQHA